MDIHDGLINMIQQPDCKYEAPDLDIGTLDLSTDDCIVQHDNQYIDNLTAEHLEISGAPVNVFKMLGVHEQGTTIDLVGEGYPVSSGTQSGYNAQNAFNTNDDSWRSVQVGAAVVTAPAWIGYSFGTKKTKVNNQERYKPSQPNRNYVTTIKLRQGALPQNRAIQLKVERSDDGVSWFLVDYVNVPDNDQLQTIKIKQSTKMQQWRISPTIFNGGSTDAWEIVEMHLLDYTATALDNVQDFVLLENRDRDYAQNSIQLKCTYDLAESMADLAKFGIMIPDQFNFVVSFAMMVKKLGRPVVVGDIVEVPSQLQYDANLNCVRKYLEVTDTMWSSEGFTPGWYPTLFKFVAVPALASQETRDIFGTPGENRKGGNSINDFLNGKIPVDLLNFQADDQIQQESKDYVPERGSDPSDISSGTDEQYTKGSYDGTELYVEDAIPPNNLPYTELVNSWPVNPKDGDYHRMLQDPKLRIPAILYRYNNVKKRWIKIEVDRRDKYISYKPTINNIVNSDTRFNINEK